MNYRFHLKLPVWVYIFIFAFSSLMLWMALTADESREYLTGYIGFTVLVFVGGYLLFLQIEKKGGIELNDKSIVVHNIPTKTIQLNQIHKVEVGYNGNKKNMRILYYENKKIKAIQFGQAYSEPLDNIAELIKLNKTRVGNEVDLSGIENFEQLEKDHNRSRVTLLNWALPGNYILLIFLVYFIDLIEFKTVNYVVFSFLFLLEITLSIFYQKGNIKITKRILISFLVFFCAVIFFIVEMIQK